jgi:hypothetical protein
VYVFQIKLVSEWVMNVPTMLTTLDVSAFRVPHAQNRLPTGITTMVAGAAPPPV